MGIYYLRSLNKEDIGTSLFGYSKKFDGLGIFLNTLLSKGVEGSPTNHNYVQGFVGDGQMQINFMKTTTEHNCLQPMRNQEIPFSLRIKYEHPHVGVFVQSVDSGKYEKCFSI